MCYGNGLTFWAKVFDTSYCRGFSNIASAELANTSWSLPGKFSVCCLHMKPFFLPNAVRTPSVRADSSSWRENVYCGPEKNKTTVINQGKASEMLAYLEREHDKTSQTRKIGNMMKSFGNK